MKILCVGGGPAGLYLAILMKLRAREHAITVFERDPSGHTYGWGVVYWDDLLAKLHDCDPESARAIREHTFRWQDQVVYVQGKPPVRLEAHGFSIGRQRLLAILARRAQDLGVEIRFEREVEDQSQLPACDLIVACDGMNSRLRRLHAGRLGTRIHTGRNKYVWLGTSKVFESFTFSFVRTDAGWIWFHGYGFDTSTSTCIVECSPETWAGLGFDRLGADKSLTLMQELFRAHLDGHPLRGRSRETDKLQWLHFQTLTNERWHDEKVALMGDAAHTAHFSIGSGTRLAIEDAIALNSVLRDHADLHEALEAYGRERRRDLRLPQRAARYSARWFENLQRYIELDAPRFAMLFSYRSSRLLARVPPRAYPWLLGAAERLSSRGKLKA